MKYPYAVGDLLHPRIEISDLPISLEEFDALFQKPLDMGRTKKVLLEIISRADIHLDSISGETSLDKPLHINASLYIVPKKD